MEQYMLIKEFYDFIVERENIRLKKENNLPWPWTQDPILREWKFTNVHRKNDKTTRELIEKFYNRAGQNSSMELILLNCAIFRYFGTWEFAEALGWQPGFEPAKIINLAANRLKNKERVFTGAYIITNQGIRAPKEEVVVNIFLGGLWKAVHRIVEIVCKTNNWQQTAQGLSTIQGFGGSGFMAKEVLLDTMHCKFWQGGFPQDYLTWTPVGPGARRGINRLLGLPIDNKCTDKDMLCIINKLCFSQDNYWPENWQSLAPTDIQFQLCEFDKWMRVKYNEGTPRSRYKFKG